MGCYFLSVFQYYVCHVTISLYNTIILEKRLWISEGVGGTWESLERGGEGQKRCKYSVLVSEIYNLNKDKIIYLGGCDDLYMLSPGSDTIRKCDPVGVGVLLWVWAEEWPLVLERLSVVV